MELQQLPITLVSIIHNAIKHDLSGFIDYHRDCVSEIIIIDQGSTDGSYEVANKKADYVFKRRKKGVADPDKNWAISLGSQPYVLFLDQDERISLETKELLPKIIKSNADIAWFKRLNLVDGVDIRELTGDDIQSRFFKRGYVEFPEKNHVHSVGRPGATVLYSNGVIIHTRTLDEVKSANRARNHLFDPEHVAMQEQFISKLETLLKRNDGFEDNWYSADQLKDLRNMAGRVKDLVGDVIEIGSWEGKSSCTIANAVHPEILQCIDTWKGNVAEGQSHLSVVKAKQRDVHAVFLSNVAKRTKGNVRDVKMDCFEYLGYHTGPIKFLHLDASHDYESVKRAIGMTMDKMVTGGIICGDDFISSGKHRTDLNGGVERAVTELLPGVKNINNFWYWIKD